MPATVKVVTVLDAPALMSESLVRTLVGLPSAKAADCVELYSVTVTVSLTASGASLMTIRSEDVEVSGWPRMLGESVSTTR